MHLVINNMSRVETFYIKNQFNVIPAVSASAKDNPHINGMYSYYDIYFYNIEDYYQIIANFGCIEWTNPYARIYYKNGTVKEIIQKHHWIPYKRKRERNMQSINYFLT